MPHNTGIKNNTHEVYTRQHTIPHQIDLTTARVLKLIPMRYTHANTPYHIK